MTKEELESLARSLAGHFQTEDQEDLFQEAYLQGLEAIEAGKEGRQVWGDMRRTVYDKVSFKASPVEIPKSGVNRVALAKVRRGEAPESAAEVRVASLLGEREEVLPITVVTTDTPESLYEEKQLLDKLEAFLEYDRFYLTKQQRDAIGVKYFGKPTPEEYKQEYGGGRGSLEWHCEKAMDKLRKVLK